ncbi:MAG: hypothetical protein IJZ19_13710 [Lentisphaeria bacterium]|nr:hypothetical protein [Lentisphaeria bacterium]
MRQFVANFTMVAWNACIAQKTFADVKKFLNKFADENFDGDPCALLPLLDAAELKWREYRNDKNIIASAEVKTVNGKPQVIAYLKDESPEISSAFKPFHDLMQSPEVQERLKNTPPEKLEEEIGKIVAEYNASLPPPVPFTIDDDDDEEDWDSDYMPISPEDLEYAYEYTLSDVSIKDKTEMLSEFLKYHRFLAPLCKDMKQQFENSERNGGSVADLILSVLAVVSRDIELPICDNSILDDFREEAKGLTTDFLTDIDDFQDSLTGYSEMFLLDFIADKVAGFNLETKQLKKTLNTLFAWGLLIEKERLIQSGDFDDFQQEESYDFDKNNLRIFQLHVKLRGFRVSVDILVREDSTFEELHNLINTLFQRDDDHLYRFECEDGCTAVRDEMDIDDDEQLAGECYIGHHLSEDCGAYYLFDYGDEWEHDITVKKIMPADTKEKYPKVLKIKGVLPEQYPG